MTTTQHNEPARRYSSVNSAKSEGSTYTPQKLARFVAEKMVHAWNGRRSGPVVRVLDPATGDGELLVALVERLRAQYQDLPIEIYGFEPNQAALEVALKRLSENFPHITATISKGDFLQHALDHFGTERRMTSTIEEPDPYDLVIANPPYVRTQVMGASQAQLIGKQFSLTGRVDLYHAFMLGISRVIGPEAVAGMIVSNRFMTTQSGASVRRALLEQLKVLEVWDFGDTKLFEAAVLPSVVLARGTRGEPSDSPIGIKSIYETTKPPDSLATDAIDATEHHGVVEIGDGRRFLVTSGELNTGGSKEGVWRIANDTTETWLETVDRNTWGTFGNIGKIRVGVKTCADKVFIRSDWEEWPVEERPELLRPVATHHIARRFKASVLEEPKLILYPHETHRGHRRAVNLAVYPRSAAYLESHRGTLEGRKYLMSAGRQWFEIWVPQDPEAWDQPKLVFRDIASSPAFWMDLDGSVVNGDCYWLISQDAADSDLLWLAAAVGNSSFIQQFYDYRFPNKLYAGRRRFMTQYVEHFPLPYLSNGHGSEIIAKSKRAYAYAGTEEGDQQARELNELIWEAFGLSIEEVGR